MVEVVRRQMERLHAEGRCPSLSARVAEALEQVPREGFVPPDAERWAYDDMPLAIGEGQTISQPLIVGLMTELASPGPEDVVLEVGTGSGYGAAVLSLLAGRVCTLEVLPDLAAAARARLADLGCKNVLVRTADAWEGWRGGAPSPDGRFDAIVVTCAAPVLPRPLLAQLRPRGRMVLPLGEAHGRQVLSLVTWGADGQPVTKPILPVAFVPMVRPAPHGGER